jgi:hypothetical protein
MKHVPDFRLTQELTSESHLAEKGGKCVRGLNTKTAGNQKGGKCVRGLNTKTAITLAALAARSLRSRRGGRLTSARKHVPDFRRQQEWTSECHLAKRAESVCAV